MPLNKLPAGQTINEGAGMSHKETSLCQELAHRLSNGGHYSAAGLAPDLSCLESYLQCGEACSARRPSSSAFATAQPASHPLATNREREHLGGRANRPRLCARPSWSMAPLWQCAAGGAAPVAVPVAGRRPLAWWWRLWRRRSRNSASLPPSTSASHTAQVAAALAQAPYWHGASPRLRVFVRAVRGTALPAAAVASKLARAQQGGGATSHFTIRRSCTSSLGARVRDGLWVCVASAIVAVIGDTHTHAPHAAGRRRRL